MNSTVTHASATIRKSELAELLQIARSRVSQLVAAGLPTLPDRRLHRQTALEWVAKHCSSGAGGWHLRSAKDLGQRAAALLAASRKTNRREIQATLMSPELPEKDHVNVMEAILHTKQRREVLRIDRETFDFERARGKFVDRQEVEDAAFRRARDERDALQSWPNRIAAIMAAELGVDERKLHSLLEKHIREFLNERSEVGPLLETARQ